MKLQASASAKSTQFRIRKYRQKKIDTNVAEFIRESFHGFIIADDFRWFNTDDRKELEPCSRNEKGVANLTRINDIRNINKFLEAANSNMKVGEYLLVCAETKNSRRKRIFDKFPAYIGIPYYILDFILKRVFPKWRPTQNLYYAITKGRNRVITATETLGRLYACGFKVVNHKTIGYNTWIIAKKVKEPEYNMEPSYGALICLNRVGHRRNNIAVYKVRTMHPYSEYLQEYIYNMNGTGNGDKITNDFRVTNWGKWFRKLWIDELPMLWNYLKGEMKLVGPRPLSEHKFNTYPEWLQEQRTKFKPGLVPPFYADLPENPEEFYQCEAAYLNAYEKQPIRTDIRYFIKAMHNIFIKRARSA